MTKYIKIDCVRHTIEEIEGEGLEFLRKQIGCEMVEYRGTVVLGKEVSLWFDEEALFNGAASRGRH